MSYIESYRKRVGLKNVTDVKSRVIYDARKNFERSLRNDPSSVTTRITDVGEINITEETKIVECLINDYSENDQKTFDEKVLYVRHDENVGLGSYVEFDNFIWLVIFKEHRASDVHKSFIMRKCNQIMKYEYNGDIYDIPCVVRNLTQYSDGLQDIVYTSVPDSRRSIMYSQNYITNNIKLGHRFLLNYKMAYRITHIQDFEFKESYDVGNGITTCIAIFTALTGDDDTENNLAFNEYSKVDIKEETIMLGSNRVYDAKDINCTWNLEYLTSSTGYVNVISNSKGQLNISIDMNFDLIGETFKLTALSLDGDILSEKNVTIVGFM